MKQLLEQHEETMGSTHLDCSDLDAMANKGCYNEIVIDADVLVGKLPHVVEAIEFPAHASDEARALARRVHAAFIAEYPEAASSTPLVSYDLSKPRAPFALAD